MSKKVRFDEFQPGDRVKTARQGTITIKKLIRIHKTPSGDVWRWETDSAAGVIAGRADLTLVKVN